MDELKKALLQHLPKPCAVSWVNRLSFAGTAVSEADLATLTDELGVVGGIARATNRVLYVLSPPGAATLQIASTWDEDLKPGKVTTVSKYFCLFLFKAKLAAASANAGLGGDGEQVGRDGRGRHDADRDV